MSHFHNMIWMEITFQAFFLIKWLSSEGIIRPKMKILSSFTHPQVVSNMYEKQLMGP